MRDAMEMAQNYHGRWITHGNVIDQWVTPDGKCYFCGSEGFHGIGIDGHIKAHILENGYPQETIDALASVLFMAGGGRHSCDEVAKAFFGSRR